MPGFAGEASLYKTERRYQTDETRAGLSGGRAFLAQLDLGPEDNHPGPMLPDQSCHGRCRAECGTGLGSWICFERCIEDCETPTM